MFRNAVKEQNKSKMYEKQQLLQKDFLSFSEHMEAKLAEYRARKKAEQDAQVRKDRAWNLLTFRFLRGNVSDPSDEDEEFTNNQPWTKVDYAILVVKLLMWVVGQVVFVKIGFGAVYFATSAFAFIWLSLGRERREPGQMSAYSVFNPNCQSIQGTITAEQLEAEIRHRKI